jgi:hypothetical protein
LKGYDEDSLQMHAALLFSEACRKTVWFHVPNGGKRDKVTAARLKQMGVRSGVADFIVLSRCRPLALELKVPKTGRQSDNQKGFQAFWEENGGVYRLARTPDEVKAFISEFKLD